MGFGSGGMGFGSGGMGVGVGVVVGAGVGIGVGVRVGVGVGVGDLNICNEENIEPRIHLPVPAAARRASHASLLEAFREPVVGMSTDVEALAMSRRLIESQIHAFYAVRMPCIGRGAVAASVRPLTFDTGKRRSVRPVACLPFSSLARVYRARLSIQP